MSKFRINGIGCSLMDFLYSGINFSSPVFQKYQSLSDGDGGLSPGRLVFADEFEKFTGKSVNEIIDELTGGKQPDSLSIGGPCIVALIHAAQMLRYENVEVSYYGMAGSDQTADQLFDLLSSTGLHTQHYQKTNGITPYTVVLSDPAYHNGKGERAFINHLGAAWDYSTGQVDPSFFDAAITVFGGTALVPGIHDDLHILLSRAKLNGSVTVVNTVFDFRNEKKNPGLPWPLGDTEKSLSLTDLLIVDQHEALKITGQKTTGLAAQAFIDSGTGAFVITDGANPVKLFSDGRFFNELSLCELPVSEAVSMNFDRRRQGDTTGCGDNFTGGILFSLARQLLNKKNYPDLQEAVNWGIVSGGFACFYLGGTYYEKEPGEKLFHIKKLYEQYLTQTEK